MSDILNKNIDEFIEYNSLRYINEIFNIFQNAYDNHLVYLYHYHCFLEKSKAIIYVKKDLSF